VENTKNNNFSSAKIVHLAIYMSSDSVPSTQSDIERLFKADVNFLYEQIIEPLVAHSVDDLQALFANVDELAMNLPYSVDPRDAVCLE